MDCSSVGFDADEALPPELCYVKGWTNAVPSITVSLLCGCPLQEGSSSDLIVNGCAGIKGLGVPQFSGHLCPLRKDLDPAET